MKLLYLTTAPENVTVYPVIITTLILKKIKNNITGEGTTGCLINKKSDRINNTIRKKTSAAAGI